MFKARTVDSVVSKFILLAADLEAVYCSSIQQVETEHSIIDEARKRQAVASQEAARAEKVRLKILDLVA